MKADGSVTICGDFKLTVNCVSNIDRSPIPKIEDLFTNLNEGVVFTKLDLSSAYQKLELDEVWSVLASHCLKIVYPQNGASRPTKLPFALNWPTQRHCLQVSLFQGCYDGDNHKTR